MKRDLAILFLGRIGSIIVALGSLRLATSILTSSEYGAYAILLAFQSFCGLFLVNPIGQYINRHTHDWFESAVLVKKLMRYQRYVSVVASIGGVLYFAWESAHSEGAPFAQSAGILALMVLAATWNTTLIPMLNMLGDRHWAVLLGLFSTTLGLFVAYCFTLYSPKGVSWFAGQALGQAVGAVYAWQRLKTLCVKHRSQPTNSSERGVALIDMATFMSFCLPLAMATGFMWIQLVGYRLGLEVLFGLDALGLAALGLVLANQVFALFETLAMQYVYPHFYHAIFKSNDVKSQANILTDIVNLLLPIYILLAICATVAAPAILKLLTDSQYHNAYYLLMAGLGIELCRVASNVFSLAAQVTQRTNSVIAPYAVGAIVLLAVFILTYKLNGDVLHFVVGLFMSGFATSICMYFMMRVEVPFVLNFKMILGLLGLLVMTEIACIFFLPVTLSLWQALILGTGTGAFFLLVAVLLLLRQSATNKLLVSRLPAGPHSI